MSGRLPEGKGCWGGASACLSSEGILLGLQFHTQGWIEIGCENGFGKEAIGFGTLLRQGYGQPGELSQNPCPL